MRLSANRLIATATKDAAVRVTERPVAILAALLICPLVLGTVGGIPCSTGASLLGRDSSKFV